MSHYGIKLIENQMRKNKEVVFIKRGQNYNYGYVNTVRIGTN